ncbi:cytochrome d ubiquinol oxidase subunit II [Pseudoalteromonas fenneropenaei]|uniref:Cytochrome d ubiquinol oxidase subunit II n=1 Tax=Pseudoalteromonas fenneropenaei TaxID=1737459 RepID=A0ABV7CIZ6_9GAMM
MLNAEQLALLFAGLMALAILVYAILDGYDLGVGMLLPNQEQDKADTMIASIGPFWDANETWLVLAVGLVLIAFPLAHSVILQALYLPASFMLVGLILRGVAFDFRAKAKSKRKDMWDKVFKGGSYLTSFSQGYMLGSYVMGFETTIVAHLFSILSGIGVVTAYRFIGAAWLIMKTTGELQQQAIHWCQTALRVSAIGIALVSIVNPIIHPNVLALWFELPMALVLLPMPMICFGLLVLLELTLPKLAQRPEQGAWLPFAIAAMVFCLCFFGLAYSFFPYVVPGKLTIFETLSAPESLNFLMFGVVFVVPTIIAYTLYSYRVFWGKVTPLSYY